MTCSDPITPSLYHGVFTALADGILVLSPTGGVTLANAAAERLLGQAPGQLRGATLRDLLWNCVAEDGSPLSADQLEALLTSAERRTLGLHRDDGSVAWVTLTPRPLFGEDGSSLGTMLTLADAGQRPGEPETHSLARRLALALNCARISAWEWDLGTDLLYYDERLTEILGSELPDPVPLPVVAALVIPEDRERVDRAMRDMIQTRQGASVEFRICRPNGELRHVQLTAEPISVSGQPRRIVGASIDITRQRLNEEAVQTVRLQLRTLIDTLPAWVAMIDRDRRCLIVNQRCADLFGLSVSEVEGRDFTQLIPGEFLTHHTASIERCLAGELVETTEEYPLPDQSTGFVQGRYVPVRQGDSVIAAVLAFTDVSELKRAQLRLTSINADLLGKVEEIRALQARVHEMAIRDPLTSLHNRRYLDERLPRELARASRAHSPLCVALGDIDHFKQLNDCYGHLAGDAVLRELAARFSRLLRESDLVCRWGGEELLIVMPDVAGEQAYRRIESLRRALADDAILYGEERLPVTISFGIAEYPRDGPRSMRSSTLPTMPSTEPRQRDATVRGSRGLTPSRHRCSVPFRRRSVP